MGVVGAVLGTLGTAYMSGRAQQQQYEAQAAQAEANAKLQQKNAEIMAENSRRSRENAELAAKNNAANTEMQRRRALMREGQQRARIGASGITDTGSAARALADTRYEIDLETSMNLYNGRQDVDKLFGQATDYTNQGAQYQYQADVLNANAKDYRAAGKRALWGSMLGGAFSLAGSLYSSNSSAAQAAQGTDSYGGTSGGWASQSGQDIGGIYFKDGTTGKFNTWSSPQNPIYQTYPKPSKLAYSTGKW